MKKITEKIGWKNNKMYATVDIYIVCLIICVFYRTIFVSTIHDDLHCSYIFGMMKYYDDSFWKSIGGVFDYFITVCGRFFPLSMHQYIVYYLSFGNEVLYKSYILIMVIINILQFRNLILRYVGSIFSARLGMLMVAGTMQYYISYHNGISGYHLFMQIMLFILICLINCLLDYRISHSKKSFWLIVVLVCISILNYEIGYLYGLISLVVIFFDKETWKKKITNCFIIGISMCALLGVNFYVRSHNAVYLGTKPNLNITLIITTFIKQCFGSMPFSYALVKGVRNGFGSLLSTYLTQLDMQDAIFVVLFVITMVALWKSRNIKEYVTTNTDAQNQKRWWDIFVWLGLYGAIGFLPALTEKYQKEIDWGVAHISCYLQSYLLVLILILCVTAICKKKKTNKLSITLYALYILLLFGMYMVKMQEIDIDKSFTDEQVNAPRDLLKSALSSGLFDEINDDSTIVVSGMTEWTIKEFMSQYSGKRVRVIDEREFDINTDISSDIYYFDYSGYFEDGMVALAKMDQIVDVTKEKRLKILTSKVYLYLNDCRGSSVKYKYENGDIFNGRSGYDMVVQYYDEKAMIMLLQDWEHGKLIQFDTIVFQKGLK